jgi:hypothetical protein
LDFSERYGDLGKEFIEAHHLRPIATLEEGVPVKYDVAADFAVLCSNCHRMIHRSSDPSKPCAVPLNHQPRLNRLADSSITRQVPGQAMILHVST